MNETGTILALSRMGQGKAERSGGILSNFREPRNNPNLYATSKIRPSAILIDFDFNAIQSADTSGRNGEEELRLAVRNRG